MKREKGSLRTTSHTSLDVPPQNRGAAGPGNGIEDDPDKEEYSANPRTL